MRPLFLFFLCVCAPTVTAQEWLDAARADVDTLTAPAYAGRGYADGGAARAAHYLGRRFAEIGLTPLGDAYGHPFTFEADLVSGSPLLVADGDTLPLGRAFLPYPSSGSGRSDGVPLVDVGHGLVLRPLGVDAYADRDVRGAAVLISSAVPDSLREIQGLPPVALSREFRMEIAAAMGARAVVFVEESPQFGFAGYDATLPVFEVRRRAWPGADTLAFHVETRQNARVEGVNVLGQVRGTDSPDTLLLVIAHYDGLGALGPDFYFPGANDNASGVAMLLSLARAFAEAPTRYSVVFAALGGEELGLNGALHLAENPPFNLDNVRFLLNFDMVASGEDGLMAFAGADFADEYALLTALNTLHGGGALHARANRANSDHYPFLERGVRGFYLLTKDGQQPYHSPRDVAETLEWDDFTRARTLAEAFLRALAGEPILRD